MILRFLEEARTARPRRSCFDVLGRFALSDVSEKARRPHDSDRHSFLSCASACHGFSSGFLSHLLSRILHVFSDTSRSPEAHKGIKRAGVLDEFFSNPQLSTAVFSLPLQLALFPDLSPRRYLHAPPSSLIETSLKTSSRP